MGRVVPVIIPLAGIGVFWLLSDSRVPVAVTWGVLAACLALGFAAACAGLIAGATVPRCTAILLRGWVLFAFLVSVLLAAGCLYVALKIGDHVGSANPSRAKAFATGLGAAIGAIAVIVNNVVPSIGYGWFARTAMGFRYGKSFPATSPRTDQGFRAGRSAVTDPGGGSVPFPASWDVPDSRELGSEEAKKRQEEEKEPLRTILIENWSATAVRRRLTLIRLALPDPAPAATKPAPSAGTTS
jgi:hypothetical protein